MYTEMEKQINQAGWAWRVKYGQALIVDPTACHPGGRLKHGIASQLISAAAAAGLPLSEREIQYRIQVAREVSSNSENPNRGADFQPEVKTGSWTEARNEAPSNWIDSTPPPPPPPPPPRSAYRKFVNLIMVREEYPDPIVDDYWLLPEITLMAIREKLRVGKKEHVREGKRLKWGVRIFKKLLDAVDGNLEASLGQAMESLAKTYKRSRSCPD